jgi:hypothetical protein
MKSIKDKLRNPKYITPNELYLRIAKEFGYWRSFNHPRFPNPPWDLINGLEASTFNISASIKRGDRSFEYRS